MQRIRLKIHGGGSLEWRGARDAQRILILTGREDYNRDLALMQRALDFFSDAGYSIAKYESARECAMRSICSPRFERLPLRLRQVLKFGRLLIRPRHWPSLSRRQREKTRSLAYRLRSFRELVEFLGRGKELVFITRSASGRALTLLADELGVSKVVCLGYPFEHPAVGPEPARYEHLETLQTPCLVIQGARDIYGGSEVVERYRFAAQTLVLVVDCDHDFQLSAAVQLDLLRTMEAWIGISFAITHPLSAIEPQPRPLLR